MKLAELMDDDTMRSRAQSCLASDAFTAELSSDKRFQLLFAYLQKGDRDKESKEQATLSLLADDVALGSFKPGARKSELILLDKGFAEHVAKALPALYQAYKKQPLILIASNGVMVNQALNKKGDKAKRKRLPSSVDHKEALYCIATLQNQLPPNLSRLNVLASE